MTSAILLHTKLPLLHIREDRSQLQLDGAGAGLGQTGRNQRLTVWTDVGGVGRNALIELVWRSDAIGTPKGCGYGRGRGTAKRVEADAGKLIDSIAAAHDGVAKEMVVEASTGEDAGVGIRSQLVRTVETSKLDTSLLAGGGIDDVGIKAVIVVVLFHGRAIELISQTEIEGEFGGDSVVVLQIAGKVIQVVVKDGVGGADACGCG